MIDLSIGDTGFTSKDQERYLRKHEPALYKRIVKKHGHYGKQSNPNLEKFKAQKNNPINDTIRGQ